MYSIKCTPLLATVEVGIKGIGLGAHPEDSIWKGHKDIDHFLVYDKVTGQRARITFKVWLRATDSS